MNFHINYRIIQHIAAVFFMVITGQLCPAKNADKKINHLSANNFSSGLNERIIFQSLPSNFDYNGVKCILKDYKGFMWFGTNDGLIRYDGVNLYVYENSPDDSASISHNSVNAMVEDRYNNLWIGTSAGLNLYNRNKDNFIHIGNLNQDIIRLNTNYVSALCLDYKSRLWVGTYGDGLNVYDHVHQRLTHYDYIVNNPHTISLDRITNIAADSSGLIWVGTQNGLNLFNRETGEFRRFYSDLVNPHSISNDNITSMVVDLDGNLWIGTRGGGINTISKRNDDILINRFNSGSLLSKFILSLNADRKGNIWIGTENGGLGRLKINSGKLDIFQVEEGYNFSISSNSIWALYCDNEDILWIGTFNKGVNVIDQKYSKFESFQKNIINKKSLTDNNVTSFAEDVTGNIWIGTDGGGICRFDPENRQFNKIIINSEGNNLLTNNAIQVILYDFEENLWVGTWAGGIDRLNKNGTRIANYKLESSEGGGNNNVLAMFQDSKGNIWAGTAGSGLFKFNNPTNKFDQVICNNPTIILTNSACVTSILEDSEGNLWIGTLYGFVILKNSADNTFSCINFSRGNECPGLSSNMIEVIFEDREKRLWFGTGDYGLNLFNRHDSTFTTFLKKDGLCSNAIFGILEDNYGNLWISTNKGLSKFNYDSLKFTNYTREDGLNSNEFYARSSLRTKKGQFYFGGENGFNVFYPENIKKNIFIPPVYLSNLKINNVQVKIGAKGSPLKLSISETNEITLNYKQNSFTIEFVALNYTRSSRNLFSFKLEGFDKGWTLPGNDRSAYYTNIKPGRYTFLVKGANNDGIWNPSPVRLHITIKPPLWRTWWAILIYVVLFSLFTGISLQIWNERIKIKHQLKLEQLAREKEHELNEANIQFFTNISHEFRTPLSLIIAPLESLIHTTQTIIKDQLQIIYRNAQRLLNLTNNLMDFRKLEEGITNLKVKYGDLLKYSYEVTSYFYVESKQRGINFAIETRESEIKGWFDPEKLETILLNLLSNAFKYTPDNGRIRTLINYADIKDIEKHYPISSNKLNPSGRYIEIIIFNNGVGISAEELPLIFDKFYQTQASKSIIKKGTGIGLALTKGLVELSHGFIRAESVPNRETRFSFILPLDIDAFVTSEIVSEPFTAIEKSIINIPNEYTAIGDVEEFSNFNSNEDKPKILIVEDNFELRSFLANELAKEFNVLQAEDGNKGIDKAMSEIPDLIITDILMPGYTGIELCSTVKSDIRTCHIPIILLTAKTTLNEQIEGIQTGADAYITKPFNIQYLLAQINQLIESREKLYAHFSQEVYIIPNKLTDNKMDQQFIQKAIDYIISNIIDNSLNVEGLSDALNLSRSNVYRKIKALTGKTIIEFIRMVRLKQAIKLMETKKYSISEIAYMIGFSSPSYFTKSFKDQYGKPPSEYLA